MDNLSLLNDLAHNERVIKFKYCKLGQLIYKLEGEEKEALIKAVDTIRLTNLRGRNKAYSTVWLSKVLRKNGHEISASTVQRHVNKECTCEQFEG